MNKAKLIGLLVGLLLLLTVVPVASAHGRMLDKAADGCPAGPRPD